MTYVIGIHCPHLKLNTILCDTKFAAADKIEGREAPALKNGLLFDGCMYGAAGNVDHIMRFVSDCRANLGNIKGAKEAFWEFTKILPEYDFWEYDDFELILSTNYGGQPTLYLLDPKTEDRLILAEIAEQANVTVTSIGSGKPLLDSAFAEYLQDHGKVGGSRDPDDLPYGWCAWFMQYARGDKALDLEKLGVGGYFHFWVQTETETKPQNTCLYVLFAIFLGIIWPYYYRIGYLQNGEILVANDLNEGDLHVIKNVWTSDDRFLIRDDIDPRRVGEFHYSFSRYNTNNLIVEELVEQFRSSLPYYFCSFGFAHPVHQFRINHINKTNTNHWIEGYSPPSISKEWLKTVFGVYVAANPIDAGTANSRLWKKFTATLYRYTHLKFRKDIKYPEITFVDDDDFSQEYTQSKPSLRTRMEGKLGHPVQDGFVQIGRGFVHTFGGRRAFVFPSLPKGLSPFLYHSIVEKFAKDYFVALGMLFCKITVDEYGIIFSCPTFERLPNGFGHKVDEWGSPDFFVKTRTAFVEHVNRELEKVGSSAYYEV